MILCYQYTLINTYIIKDIMLKQSVAPGSVISLCMYAAQWI